MGRTRRTSPKATPHASNKGGTPPYHHLLSCEIGPPSCKAQPCKFHRTTQLSGCPSELSGCLSRPDVLAVQAFLSFCLRPVDSWWDNSVVPLSRSCGGSLEPQIDHTIDFLAFDRLPSAPDPAWREAVISPTAARGGRTSFSAGRWTQGEVRKFCATGFRLPSSSHARLASATIQFQLNSTGRIICDVRCYFTDKHHT